MIYGRSRCTGDPDMYYDQRCFEFDGSGTLPVTEIALHEEEVMLSDNHCTVEIAQRVTL